MNNHQYLLLESSYDAGGITYTVYGVALADCSDGSPVILQAFADLSPEKDPVARLAKQCTELSLSADHFADVIDDFLAQQ